MSDGKLIAGLCLKVPLCSEDMSSLFSYTEKIRAEGFQAGAASRDAEIAKLKEQNWELISEKAPALVAVRKERDQLRTELAAALAAVQEPQINLEGYREAGSSLDGENGWDSRLAG